jgi:hypothetical protein
MQFCWSAVQIKGRLFGIDTTTSDGTAAPFGGMAAFAGMAGMAFATARLACALAVAAAVALAALCFSSLSSFCSRDAIVVSRGDLILRSFGRFRKDW